MSLQGKLSFCVLLAAVLLVGLGWRAEARSMQASRLHNGKPSQYLPPSFFVCKTADPFVCVRCSECGGILMWSEAQYSELRPAAEFRGDFEFSRGVCAVCKNVPCAKSCREYISSARTFRNRWREAVKVAPYR